FLRDRARQRLRIVEPRRRGIHVDDEPDVLRLLRADEAPGEDELVRDPLPHRARQALRPAGAGDDAEVYLRLTELRGLRRHDDVADHRELAASTERESGDRSDDRRLDATDDLPLRGQILL